MVSRRIAGGPLYFLYILFLTVDWSVAAVFSHTTPPIQLLFRLSFYDLRTESLLLDCHLPLFQQFSIIQPEAEYVYYAKHLIHANCRCPRSVWCVFIMVLPFRRAIWPDWPPVGNRRETRRVLLGVNGFCWSPCRQTRHRPLLLASGKCSPLNVTTSIKFTVKFRKQSPFLPAVHMGLINCSTIVIIL